MATNNKNFIVKNGLIVGNSTNLVNYSSASPSGNFLGQLWISESSLYAWSSASTWVLIGDGNSGGVGGGTASGTPLNIPNTLIARSASGSFQIGSVDFHTASPVVSAIGRITWDDGEGTAVLGLGGGNVNLKIGQEEVARCYNGTGSTISKGSVVYISGAQGQRPSISLSNASSEITSSKTFGLAAESIADGAEGLVCTFGIVEGIDTSTFTDGSSLWLSASSGLMTNDIPVAPIHMVFVGYCIKSHATAGRIFVKPQNGYEIQELHNVLINGVNNTDILSYNSASSLWMNKDLQAAIKEVDGAGSGIDADLLDGEDSSYFLNTSNTTQEKTGNITFHGTLTVNELVVSGSSAFIATQDLTVTDSLIFLASEQYTTDGLDIGFIGSYGDGTTSSAAHYHASFARDASQNKWKLLSNGPAPVNNVIDYTDPSVEFGVLQLETIEVSSSAIVTNLNADMLDGYNSTYFLSTDTASSTYMPLSSPKTGTASIVYSNNSILIMPLLQSPKEITTISATSATGSVNYDIISQTVLYYTSSAIANWHLNLRGNSSTTLSSLMNVGDAITLVFEVTQGTTAYYQLNTMIDGVAITPKWQGGSAPTGGNTSGIDVYSFTIIKTAATPTYTVLGTLTGFA